MKCLRACNGNMKCAFKVLAKQRKREWKRVKKINLYPEAEAEGGKRQHTHTHARIHRDRQDAAEVLKL